MSEPIKCLVWDLDNTTWTGILAEGDLCRFRPGIENVLRELDSRGILLSIASANDELLATDHLRKLGIDNLFVGPQIQWGDKVTSIQRISAELDVAFNAIGFIDDEPFQREQVRNMLPDVRTYDALIATTLLDRPEFSPAVLTEESRQRRRMYTQNKQRTAAENRGGISRQEFLMSCRTEIALRLADKGDVARILELLKRTHQLNATGIVFDPGEVAGFFRSPDHRIYIASMKDRFVDYGRIGVVICHCTRDGWTILSCLLSCRVLGRGVGNVFLSWLEAQAYKSGASRLQARYVKQERNRPMYILYTMAGFEPVSEDPDGCQIFSKECGPSPAVPEWLVLKEGSGSCALSESS